LPAPVHKVDAVSESSPKQPPSSTSGRADPAADLAKRVAAARLRSGLTQAELAEASGVTDETISRIERGRYEPAVSTLFRLAEALDISLDRLAGEPARDSSPPRPRSRISPVVRRLRARIDALTPDAQRALLAIAERLPEVPRPPRAPR
jgi:transcriptional regulator with XRE-family HTH domain